MSTFAQTPFILAPGGFGVNHDYSVSASAGNTLVIMTPDYGDITGVELIGAVGSFGAANFTSTPGLAYSYKNLPSGVTGIRIITSGSHTDAEVVIFEGVGELDFDVGDFMPGDFTDTVSITVTTTGTDPLYVAKWLAGSDTFTPDTGYAASTVVSSQVAEYNSSPLGAAGSKTISGVFSGTIGGRGGFAVAYKAAAGGGGGTNFMGRRISVRA